MASTGSPDYRDSGLEFPPDFVIGSATASLPDRGRRAARTAAARRSGTPSATPRAGSSNGDTGDIADDHYHRLDSDLDLMASLGLEAYRFSIAWPRIQADGTGKPNEKGLAFYGRLVDGLLERGIRPVATLYHWDLPQALEDTGGWVNRDTALRFTEYAAHTVEALGDRVHTWTTFNEPWCSAYLGYGSGAHAPGRTDGAAALAAVHHLNLAHGLAVPEIRRAATQRARGLDHAEPARDPHPEDATPDDRVDEAKRRIDALANRAFLVPLLRGRYDDDLLDRHRRRHRLVVPAPRRRGASSTSRSTCSGVNYYSTVTVKMWDGVSPARRTPTGTRTSADPRGRAAATSSSSCSRARTPRWAGTSRPTAWRSCWSRCTSSSRSRRSWSPRTGPRSPTGVVETDAGKRVPDADRVDYLNRHFTAAHRAIARGVDLQGYFVWSLLDNFEWGWGYTKRFGIVRVDYDTQERIVKDSARWLQELIATRRTPPVE